LPTVPAARCRLFLLLVQLHGVGRLFRLPAAGHRHT
jgi:hypothetical protein